MTLSPVDTLNTYLLLVIQPENNINKNDTKTILITKGINPQQIIVSGIPVKKNFITKKEHKKSTNKTEILIMGGGLGIIPISSKILDRLVENKHIHLTIITGKNVRFKKYLEKNYPDINALGYVSNVYRYMRKSDMVITKPGGITTFEAINMGTPLYVFKPFLFQERDNAKYIEMQNIGKIIENEEDLISSVENEMLLNEMKKNMFEIKKNWNRNNALNYCKKESK